MKKRMTVDITRSHPGAIIACVLMGAAAAVRLTYFLSASLTLYVIIVHLLLPVSAAVLFIAGTVAEGKWFRILSIGAVALGIAFFIAKAFAEFSPIHRNLCTLLYITVITTYTLTVSGVIPTKKLLYPLFGLPFLYHVFVEDTQYYFFADPPVPVWEWMPEISVLCIMAALFSQAFAMKTAVSDNLLGENE